jgi:hypothetical protein
MMHRWETPKHLQCFIKVQKSGSVTVSLMMGVEATELTWLWSRSHVFAELTSWSFLLISKVPSGLQFGPTTEHFNQLKNKSEEGYTNINDVRLFHLSGTKSPHLPPHGSPWKQQVGAWRQTDWPGWQMWLCPKVRCELPSINPSTWFDVNCTSGN